MTMLFRLVIGTLIASPAMAVPFLQIDISGGVYDTQDESIHNTTNPFTLQALVNSSSKKSYIPGNTYYLAVAVTPQQPWNSTLVGFGSFKVDNVQYDAGALAYGTPTGLSPHGIYGTWFKELSFDSFTGKAGIYDVPSNPGGLVDDPNGKLLYRSFEFDITLLGSAYELHIDLYTKKLDKNGNLVVDTFAPFSHDAQDDNAGTPVPDGGSTVIMLSAVFILIGLLRRRVAS